MMRMSPYEYAMMWMPPCGYAMMRMPPCGHVVMQMQFNQKFLLFSKLRLPRSLEPKCFQYLIYFSQRLFLFILARLECSLHHSCPKNIFYFDFKASKKMVIIVRSLRMGCQLKIRWFGSKRFIFMVRLRKGVASFQDLFLKQEFFEKSSILKRFIFTVPEYDDLIRSQDPPW